MLALKDIETENGLLKHSIRIEFNVGAEIFGLKNGDWFSTESNHHATFENVWDHANIFVRASFVNATSFQYLGRDGDFFHKPSKM